ncbi:hypothetical protein O9X98_07700 [Agrobacterium salinitolerans]|nr:hypothetical protein [Agrobacterium salinitolerans]
MPDNLERTLFVGMLSTFVDTMNKLTLGFRQEPDQSSKEETCIVTKLDSGDTIRLWFRPDDPSRLLMTNVPLGADYGRFGIKVEGERVDVGFYGRGSHLPASAIPTTIALLRRWRELAIAAQGQALIVFPDR